MSISPPPIKRQRTLQSESICKDDVKADWENGIRSSLIPNALINQPRIRNDDEKTDLSSVFGVNGSHIIEKCCQCKKSTNKSYDPLKKCPSCNRHFHDGCRKPRPQNAAERITWRCSTCIRKGRSSLSHSVTNSRDSSLARPLTHSRDSSLTRHLIPTNSTDTLVPVANSDGYLRDQRDRVLVQENPRLLKKAATSLMEERRLSSSGVLDPGFDEIFESDAMSQANLDKFVHESTLSIDSTEQLPITSTPNLIRSEIPPTPTLHSSQIPVRSPAFQHLQGDNSSSKNIVSQAEILSSLPSVSPLRSGNNIISTTLCHLCKTKRILPKKGDTNATCHDCKRRRSSINQDGFPASIPETPDHSSLPAKNLVNCSPKEPTSRQTLDWVNNDERNKRIVPRKVSRNDALSLRSLSTPNYYASDTEAEAPQVNTERSPSPDTIISAESTPTTVFRPPSSESETELLEPVDDVFDIAHAGADTGDTSEMNSFTEEPTLSVSVPNLPEHRSEKSSLTDGYSTSTPSPDENEGDMDNLMEESTLPSPDWPEIEKRGTLMHSAVTDIANTPRLVVTFDNKAGECKSCRILLKENLDQPPIKNSHLKHGRFSYRELIGSALLSAGTPLMVVEIRDWIVRAFPEKYYALEKKKGQTFIQKNLSSILSNHNDFRKTSISGQKAAMWTFANEATKKRYSIAAEQDTIIDESSLMSRRVGEAHNGLNQFHSRQQQSMRDTVESEVLEIDGLADERSNTSLETNDDAIKLLRELVTQVSEPMAKQLNRVVHFLKIPYSDNNRQVQPESNRKLHELGPDLKLECSFDKAYPEYSEPLARMTKDDIDKKIQEIKKRPSRKARFGELLATARYLREDVHDELGHKPKTILPDPNGDVLMNEGEREVSLKEALNLPHLTIPILHDGQLAFRDGTIVNGKLPRSRVVYKIGRRF
ncbi:hypothetical protein B0J11DRAFT_298788 [Dendryphion nanum]|uniref:PHD-type domain-containing protein n=1 Tax=Dendryphion nanum TaxID=256645 RepID=A0A9P9ILT7_9PLEO|nr:hypothetical protein B0J11DRAFT_298788 [Dendryphion nanum]